MKLLFQMIFLNEISRQIFHFFFNFQKQADFDYQEGFCPRQKTLVYSVSLNEQIEFCVLSFTTN